MTFGQAEDDFTASPTLEHLLGRKKFDRGVKG